MKTPCRLEYLDIFNKTDTGIKIAPFNTQVYDSKVSRSLMEAYANNNLSEVAVYLNRCQSNASQIGTRPGDEQIWHCPQYVGKSPGYFNRMGIDYTSACLEDVKYCRQLGYLLKFIPCVSTTIPSKFWTMYAGATSVPKTVLSDNIKAQQDFNTGLRRKLRLDTPFIVLISSSATLTLFPYAHLFSYNELGTVIPSILKDTDIDLFANIIYERIDDDWEFAEPLHYAYSFRFDDLDGIKFILRSFVNLRFMIIPKNK